MDERQVRFALDQAQAWLDSLLADAHDGREPKAADLTEARQAVALYSWMTMQYGPSTNARPSRRGDTPARWQQALERAHATNVCLYQIDTTGEYIATSGSRHLVAYRTDGVACECAAALLGDDPVCQHRAIYREAMGTLALEQPTMLPANVIPFPVTRPRPAA